MLWHICRACVAHAPLVSRHIPTRRAEQNTLHNLYWPITAPTFIGKNLNICNILPTVWLEYSGQISKLTLWISRLIRICMGDEVPEEVQWEALEVLIY